jgi:hypothetical protein
MASSFAYGGAGLIDLLLGEHGCILALMRHEERRLPSMSLRELKECGAAMEAVLQAHAVEEDQLLFGALGDVPPAVRATLEAMFGEHQEMRALLDELKTIRHALRARSLLARLFELAREHFAVEERVLFGLVRQWLAPEQLLQLGQEYARRRGLQISS